MSALGIAGSPSRADVQPLEMQYKDVTLKIDRETGQVLDKTQVPFTEDSMVLFTGEGEKSDWRVLKVCL